MTGHKHQISEGEARLSEKNGTLYLRLFSDLANLTYVALDIDASEEQE